MLLKVFDQIPKYNSRRVDANVLHDYVTKSFADTFLHVPTYQFESERHCHEAWNRGVVQTTTGF